MIAGRTGRYGILDRSTALLTTWTEVTRTRTLLSDQSLTLTDTNPPSPKCFYQVEVEMPWAQL